MAEELRNPEPAESNAKTNEIPQELLTNIT